MSFPKNRKDDGMQPKVDGPYIPQLMVADITDVVTDLEVQEYFSKFGEMEHCQLHKNQQARGRAKGYGFIKYKTSKGTKQCLLMKHSIKGKSIDVRFTKQSLQMLQLGYGLDSLPDDHIPIALFVGKLPRQAKNIDLKNLFSKYGMLKDIYIPVEARGFAFVTFGSVSAAFKAMSDVHTLFGQQLALCTASKKKPHNNNNPAGGGAVNMDGGGEHNNWKERKRVETAKQIENLTQMSGENQKLQQQLQDNLRSKTGGPMRGGMLPKGSLR